MTLEEMFAVMPHRGMNVLIDEYEEASDGPGEGRLTIAEGDPHGREIFLDRCGSGPRYLPFFLVEHVALAALMAIRDEMGGGRLAYFSKISRFRGHADAPAGAAIKSIVRRGRDRGEFRAFDATVFADEVHVLDVAIMAFLAPRDGALPAGPAGAAPSGNPADRPELFPGLRPSMVFVSGSGVARGVYPGDHPHVPGHFPGAPVMMGMAQWLALAQALALRAPSGWSEVAGSGRLVTSDDRVAAEAAGMRLSVTRDEGGTVSDFRLLSTKKVVFRDSILPGDRYSALVDLDG